MMKVVPIYDKVVLPKVRLYFQTDSFKALCGAEPQMDENLVFIVAKHSSTWQNLREDSFYPVGVKGKITVGNIHTQSGAEKLLQEGKADMVAIGRPIFKDADFARNMMNN